MLLRLLDNGSFDLSFGADGVVNEAPFVPAMPTTTMWGMAEAYGVTAQSNGGYVTVGYGREAPSGPVDIVAFRFGADGKRDTAWGTGGSTIIDLKIADERGRNLLTLPNDRILIVGSGTPATGNIDALVSILGADGKPDTTFDTDGVQLFSFDRPDEALFGVALSPDKAWAVATGYRAGAVAGVTEDDDATLVILPVAGGAPTAKVVALSETSNDRFWAAAVDAAGKIYGAGFVRDGGDNAMVVARFGADGTLDATFGTGGVTKINVSAAGTLETARAIVIQNDGRVVIGGVAEAQ